jgi:uncharacterized protein (TIGR02421 family)
MKSEALIIDFSDQLKDISQGLSFLGRPRYSLKYLLEKFPQHQNFISQLEDISIPPKVNPEEKRQRIREVLINLERADLDPWIKKIFTNRLEDYNTLLRMMEVFGTVFFYQKCTELYGTGNLKKLEGPFHYFIDEVTKLLESDQSSRTFTGDEGIKYLEENLGKTYPKDRFEVKASTSLLSDSSAGRRVLKLNTAKTFTENHLRIFLVHEGWAHLGTSLNGQEQPVHHWLGSWAPRTTLLQEGLAVLVELITGSMTLERWQRIKLRHLACLMAEKGSNLTEVYHFLCHQEMDELDAFKLALRVFRGVDPRGGQAFTKEFLYLHGLVQLIYHLNFFNLPLSSVFAGKISFDEHVAILAHQEESKIVSPFFPEELNSPECLARLQKLKDLCRAVFKGGFE